MKIATAYDTERNVWTASRDGVSATGHSEAAARKYLEIELAYAEMYAQRASEDAWTNDAAHA
jgi:hypothetical protein